MSSHVTRTYLNTCLKVPIDPCNNCPAPVFNRPKMYLGRLSATSITSHIDVGPKHTVETEHKWSSCGIRSLAKLYNSIPDYGDLNHLSGEEFYSTLNTLRSTCQQLKVKSGCFSPEDRCSTTTTSSILTNFSSSQLDGCRNKKKSKKSKKKKKTVESKNPKCFHEDQEVNSATEFLKADEQENFSKTTESIMHKKSLPKSFRKDFQKDADIFKKPFRDFEVEFKRPLTSLNRNEFHSLTRHSSKDFFSRNDKGKPNEKIPVRSNLTTKLREHVRKSWSFNDLRSLREPPELVELRNNNQTLELLSFKGQSNNFKDPTKMSNYFQQNSKTETTEIPNIIVESATGKQLSSGRLPGKIKSQHKRIPNEEYKVPFKLFELDTGRKGNSFKPKKIGKLIMGQPVSSPV